MSLICNTGRPPKDDALQNLTVNDTLRVNNLVKSTKAEIDRLCSQIETVQNVPIVLAGSFSYSGQDSENGFELFLLPSGFTPVTSASIPPSATNLWYTPQDLTVEKLQVSLISTVSSTFDVSVGFFSSPSGPITGVSTIILSVGVSTVELQTSVPSNTVIPAGSYITISVTSGSLDLTGVQASWTLHLNP
jgi:hypothetical protein